MRKLAALGAALCTLATWGISSRSPQPTPAATQPATVATPQPVHVNDLTLPAPPRETIDEWAERACIEDPGVDRGLSLDACVKVKTLRHRAYMDAAR
jgi:hypothetical protein